MVAFARMIRPVVDVVTYPQGARSYSSSRLCMSSSSSVRVRSGWCKVFFNALDGFRRRAHVRAVSRCAQFYECAAPHSLMNITSDRFRGDVVLRALQDQSWNGRSLQVGPVIREK